MKLQLLLPRYKEPFEIIKPMLDSLEIQQGIDFNDFGVIIVNDGKENLLDIKLFESYHYKIEYYAEEHRGVSATRNSCLDKATADYVMFCDCDDMFFSIIGLWTIFSQIEKGFDTFVSVFVEEGIDPTTGDKIFYPRGSAQQGIDSTFVHGKVHNRKFLLRNKIRWNDNLTIHEDSYFNCLCQRLASPERTIYCSTPFYLWKWNDNSVCRHDPKYILKTYNNMIDSNTALIKQFLERGRTQDAQFYCLGLIYDAYYTMNKDEWVNQENKEYRDKTELRFKEYFLEFKNIFNQTTKEMKSQISNSIRNRMVKEGMNLEKITFDQWIQSILEKEKD